MHYYATFYVMSYDHDGAHPSHPIPALGSDGTIRIDGRLALDNVREVCRDHAKRHASIHTLVGYTVDKGTRLDNGRTVVPYTTL